MNPIFVPRLCKFLIDSSECTAARALQRFVLSPLGALTTILTQPPCQPILAARRLGQGLGREATPEGTLDAVENGDTIQAAWLCLTSLSSSRLENSPGVR